MAIINSETTGESPLNTLQNKADHECVMKILLIFILLLFPVHLYAQTNEELEKLDKQYQACRTPSDLHSLAQAVLRLLSDNPNSYDLNWKMAGVVWSKGDLLSIQYAAANLACLKPNHIKDIFHAESEYLEDQRAELLKMGMEARKYAEKAVSLNDAGIEGHFLNALGISLYAQGKTMVGSLTEGLYGKFNQAVDASMKIDRKFAEGALLRLAGRSAYKLPWPLRDNKKSLNLLLEAIDCQPGALRSWLYLADTYYQMNKITEAKAAYRRVIQMTPTGVELRGGEDLKVIAQTKLNALK